MEFNVNECKVMHVGNSDDNSTCYMKGSVSKLSEKFGYLDIS